MNRIMNRTRLVFSLLALLASSASILFAELLELSSKDGRSIHVAMDNYDPQRGLIAARINGQGSIVSFDEKLLDDSSVEAVRQWFKVYTMTKMLRFEIVRVPGDEKGTCRFEVNLSNSAKEPIEDIRIDYFIAYKERYLAQIETNNPDVKKYEDAEAYHVVEGSHSIESIPVRRTVEFATQTVPTENIQTITRNPKKGPEELHYKNSVQGIYMEIYSGEQLVLTEASKPSMKQIVDKFSQ